MLEHMSSFKSYPIPQLLRELGGIYGSVRINIEKAVISVMNSLILRKLDESKSQ